eukprot:s42_g20.t1
MVGRYVGTHGRNGDILVMSKDGVIKGSSVKRMSQHDRWDPKDLSDLKGTPWNLRPKAVEDVDSLPVKIELPAVEGKLTPEPVQRDGAPRNLYVKRKDVEGNYTLGCPGAECRTAVQQRLMQSDEGKLRVEQAQKRKKDAAEGGSTDGQVALEDVPDVGEEMHGPDAIGAPPPERASKRLAEEGKPDGAEKKARLEPAHGVKRSGTDLGKYEEDERTMMDLYKDIIAEEKTLKSDKSSAAALEITSLLETQMFPGTESKKQVLEIGQLLCAMGISKSDVAEIYNPERFVSRANAFVLRPGFAIDLTLQKNEKGEYWDLSTEKDQRELDALLNKEKPLFLVGSPPCGPFSPLQNLSKGKRTPEQNEEILEEGRTHLRVSVDSLVVREIKARDPGSVAEHESFSAMPPLEALKAKNKKANARGWRNLAASIWQETYSRVLSDSEIRQSTAWPALFYHPGRDLRFLVHGDDFIALGSDESLKFLENVLLQFDKATGVLRYEADPRHAEQIVKALNLEGCKPVATPAEKQKLSDVLAAEEMSMLEPEQASKYRSLTMRAAYLSMDRADLGESVKTLARYMQKPHAYAWSQLKRLGRYLAGRMRVITEFKPQKMFNTIRVFCDADFAGDLKTRRSTTGIVAMLGACCVKHSSNLQSTVSLSSGESEFYALVSAASIGLGIKAMLDDWDIPTQLVLLSDSSAGRAIASRKGLGKVRHVQTRDSREVFRSYASHRLVQVRTDVNLVLSDQLQRVFLDLVGLHQDLYNDRPIPNAGPRGPCRHVEARRVCLDDDLESLQSRSPRPEAIPSDLFVDSPGPNSGGLIGGYRPGLRDDRNFAT